MHSCFMTAGLRLQNTLGFLKVFILTSIVAVGIAHLAGVPGFELKGDVEVPDNLRWSKLWEGSGNGATAFVTGLYNVIWWETCSLHSPWFRDTDVRESPGRLLDTVTQTTCSLKSVIPSARSKLRIRLP